jgi:hypothetical protein
MKFDDCKTSWREIWQCISSPFDSDLTSYISCKNRHIDLRQKYKEGKTVLCMS